MTDQRCENCRFWENEFVETEPVGFCRRYAPKPHTEVKKEDALAFWPRTDKEEWCGEWQRKPARPLEITEVHVYHNDGDLTSHSRQARCIYCGKTWEQTQPQRTPCSGRPSKEMNDRLQNDETVP